MSLNLSVTAIQKLVLPRGVTIDPLTPCLFGVSVSDHPLSIERNLAGLAWIEQHFSNYACLVGDSLYRMTLRIRHGGTNEDAEARAIATGTEYLTRLTSGLLIIPKVIRTSHVLHAPEFEQAAKFIQIAFKENGRLQKSILADAHEYCERQARSNRIGISVNDAIEISVQYLLEELAIYQFLAERGWLGDVYPGPGLPTLSKFISGELSGISAALERRMYIELEFRRRVAS
jgi:tRNA-dependent cyclodipeptide synthase